ncbi:MAG: KH domain-containing protein [Verrucomicrobiales bacterium]|nr:KH domain-containing protein [Verrucomicrobiales bacterium]
MQAELAIQEYLEYVVAQLIKHPEDAGVLHEEKGSGRHLYRIKLHPEDTGRVIGRSGKTIGAIRSLAIAAAQKNHIKVDVELEDDE